MTLEGRQKVIDELHAMHPEGLDGLILSAAVSGACGSLTKIISLNYFGAVSVIKGTYDLLEKKHGSCVAVSSNVISQGIARMDIADLLNNCGDDGHHVHSAKASLNALPIPTRYGQETFMDPKEIALAIVFLASEKACGINGIVMFVDGGTDALLNTEKVY